MKSIPPSPPVLHSLVLTTSLALLQPALAAAPPAQSDTAPAVSVAPITRVELYPDSAVLERRTRVRAGDKVVEIPGLPANFDVQALQIEAEGGVRIGDTVVVDSARNAPLTAEEARLEGEIRRLKARIDAIEVDRKAAELELKYLDSLASPSESPRAAQPAATLQALRQGSIQAQRRVLEAQDEKARLEPTLNGLTRDLERIRPAISEVRSLRIRIDAARDGILRLRYPVADAGWRPAYRASLSADGATVKLERTAQLAQRTGEDWSGVSVSLLTGSARRTIQGPQPSTWNVQLRPEYRAERAFPAAAPMALAPAPAALAKAVAEPAGPAPLFQVAASHGEFATEYVLSDPLTLPADGRRMNVALEQRQLPVKLQVQVSPRQDKAAYLVARGELPEGVWPAGELQLYRNGAYVGSRNWDASQTSGLELPFGRDDQVRVTLRSVATRDASSGFVGQSAERQIADTITVSSRHSTPVQLLVLEASPVSRDEKVEVSSKFTPPVSKDNWNGRSGVVAWEYELKPGASQDFSVDYRIRWPKERQVIGLP